MMARHSSVPPPPDVLMNIGLSHLQFLHGHKTHTHFVCPGKKGSGLEEEERETNTVTFLLSSSSWPYYFPAATVLQWLSSLSPLPLFPLSLTWRAVRVSAKNYYFPEYFVNIFENVGIAWFRNKHILMLVNPMPSGSPGSERESSKEGPKTVLPHCRRTSSVLAAPSHTWTELASVRYTYTVSPLLPFKLKWGSHFLYRSFFLSHSKVLLLPFPLLPSSSFPNDLFCFSSSSPGKEMWEKGESEKKKFWRRPC